MPAMPRRKTDRPADGRKARRADPPYMVWTDGKGKWIPGPALRKEGWTTLRLVDDRGAYLPRGLARIMARDINQDLDRWKVDPDASGRTYGPLREPRQIVSPGRDDRTLANAFARMMDHPDIRQLAPKSRDGYKYDLARFIAWAGNEHPGTVDRSALSSWIEAEWDRIYAIRSMGWSDDDWMRAPRTRGSDDAAHVPDVRAQRWEAFDAARHKTNIAGQAQVKGYVLAISRLYNFIIDELEWLPATANPAARFRMRQLKPRLRLPADAELAHLVETADAIDMPAVGDALVILSNLCPRPADMVGWTLDTLKRGHVSATIQKTGAVVAFKLPRRVRRRGAAILWRRRAWQADRRAAGKRDHLPPQILLTDATWSPFAPEYINRQFAQVRAEAVKTMTSCADLTPYDFRKLGITRLHLAKNSRDAIAAISGHSYATINAILDNYIVPTREAADAALDRSEARLDAKGVKW